MINFIWAGMILVGIVVAVFTGNIEAVTESAINSAQTAVDISLGLVGIMTLWLGIMKIAEDSGFVEALARGLKPIMIRLFPDVPAEHPAMGAIIMNIAANMLGLGNAATPFGIKAMQELQTLNNTNDTATNAMVTFLAINTSAVTLIPVNTIAILNSAGATNATSIIGPTLVATTISTVVAVFIAKAFSKMPKYKLDDKQGNRG